VNALLICPPEWNLTPHEYSDLCRQRTRGSGGRMMSSSLVFSLLFLVVGSVVFSRFGDHEQSRQALGYLGGMAMAALPLLFDAVNAKRVRARANARLEGLDAAECIDVSELDEDLRDRIETQAKIVEGTQPGSRLRQAGLRDIWSTAQQLCIEQHDREAKGSSPTQASGGQRQDLIERLRRARARYDTVADEWGAICTDPLAALDNAALLDVTNSRTAAFIEAYGRAQDATAVIGVRTASTEHTSEYEDLVRGVEIAWSEARRHAERVGYEWLPAPERDLARKAAALLARAADETASCHERASAAEKAASILRRIETVLLPEPALQAIEQASRLALPGAPVADSPKPGSHGVVQSQATFEEDRPE
jgi:hypothetical protein